jgi:hypothetical protein
LCVFGKTHGKATLCRAPEKIRTANMEFPVVMAAHQQQIAYNHVAC